MYTQCPECGTVFRVTAIVLRAAQGQVRCGVCDTAFDALRFLSDEVEADANAVSSSRIAAAPPTAPDGPEPSTALAPGPALTPAFIAPLEPTPTPEPVAATRHTASQDEERALADIAATLARDAQPMIEADVAAAPDAGPDAVLEGMLDADDLQISDAALEFDLPADQWDDVFVADPSASGIMPLDMNLEPPAGDSTMSAPDEILILEAEADALERTDEFMIPLFADGSADAPPPLDLMLEPGAAIHAAHLLVDADMAAVFADEAETAKMAAKAEPAEAQWAALPESHTDPFADVAPIHADEPAEDSWSDLPASLAAEFRQATEAAEPQAGLDSLLGIDEAPRTPMRHPGVALAAAAALVLLLAGQLLHFYRDTLAELPTIGPLLTAFYERIGLPIETRWEPGAYDVRQWGDASAEPNGGLRLRASVVNRSPRAQPYPLLRVTLEDRFGGKVASREFTPAEYLPTHATPTGRIDPGARADADLSLADPGSQAVGFELDVCYPRRGGLACGADAKLARAGE